MELTLEQIAAADEIGIKLEITEGLPTWEFMPSAGHQLVWMEVSRSLRPGPGSTNCSCVVLPDTLILFPDGSKKRPDLSIYCEMPKELFEAVKSVPLAVVEVISSESRRKDLEINPPFYLKHGVKDVVVIDPIPSLWRGLLPLVGPT